MSYFRLNVGANARLDAHRMSHVPIADVMHAVVNSTKVVVSFVAKPSPLEILWLLTS